MAMTWSSVRRDSFPSGRTLDWMLGPLGNSLSRDKFLDFRRPPATTAEGPWQATMPGKLPSTTPTGSWLFFSPAGPWCDPITLAWCPR